MTERGRGILETLNGSRPVKAWTIQRPAWWESLRKQGTISGDGRRACADFRPAYRWMMAQMRNRLPAYCGAFPVWFWLSPKPDLRHSGHLTRGERAFRIEVELPRECVLLSDFETWHCVLNRWHLSLSWQESRAWDRKVEQFDQFRSELPEELESELRGTWNRIFDLDAVNRTELWGPVDRIQGVVERVRLSQVRDVQEFVAR